MAVTYLYELDLQSAINAYANLVPWILEKKDLSIINSVRRKTPTSEATKIDASLAEKLWRSAQR